VGKKDCQEYVNLSDAIKINDVDANAVRRILNQAPRGKLDPNPQATLALQDFIRSHQGANIALVRIRDEHARQCPECQKGD
jgi:hypothetical protein